MKARLCFCLALLCLCAPACTKESATEPAIENPNLLLMGRIIDWGLGDTMRVSAELSGPNEPDSIAVLASAHVRVHGGFAVSIPPPPARYVYRHFGDTTAKFCILGRLTIRNPRMGYINSAFYAFWRDSDSASIGDFRAYFMYANRSLGWTDTSVTLHGWVPPYDTTILISNVQLVKGWNQVTYRITAKRQRVTVMVESVDNAARGNWYLEFQLQANQRHNPIVPVPDEHMPTHRPIPIIAPRTVRMAERCRCGGLAAMRSAASPRLLRARRKEDHGTEDHSLAAVHALCRVQRSRLSAGPSCPT